MLQVSIDGAISFNSAVPAFTPTVFPLDGKVLIAPYWGDSNTRGGGTVWYIETTSPEFLTRANTDKRCFSS